MNRKRITTWIITAVLNCVLVVGALVAVGVCTLAMLDFNAMMRLFER